MNTQQQLARSNTSAPHLASAKGSAWQHAATNVGPIGEALSGIGGTLNSPGHPLDARTPALGGAGFGRDFSRVRVRNSTAPRVQTQLIVNQPGDVYEEETERSADQVVGMSASVGLEAGGASGRLQRLVAQPGRQPDAAPASVGEALANPGRPLEPALRQDMEQHFGYEFSRVRVHLGGMAEQSAREVNAHAYTVGHDIVFGARQFAPETRVGRRLLAHELAHVVQQMPTSGVSASHLSFGMLQRDVDSEAEDHWDKLSPDVRKKAEELYEDCDDTIGLLDEAQMIHDSRLRQSWLNFLRRLRTRIENLDSDGKLTGLKNVYADFSSGMGRELKRARTEWSNLKDRYLDLHRWLLSMRVRSIDSIEAAKYLESIYQQTASHIPFLVTEDDYAELKNAIDKQEYIRIGALRGTRIRAKQLDQMMDEVAGLMRKAEDANKYIPEWRERVQEEAAYLDSFATLAQQSGREYVVELRDMRKRLLEKQQETAQVKPPDKSVLEKGASFLKGGVEAVVGIFVEAAKQVVDLVQINLHFVTFGKYEPRFISDLAAAAEQGATTGQLLKGMVTGIVETPSRFLKACKDGDWEAIGRESVNLYMLAKTLREAPEQIKKIPEVIKNLPELLAKTRESLRILRQRTVALGLKIEGRLMPEPAPRTPLAPKPASGVGVETEPTTTGGRSNETKSPARTDEAPRTTKPVTEAERNRTVHERAKQGGSEVKLSDETHGIAVTGEGANRDFSFCSPHCSLLRDKVNSILDVLPEKHPSRPELVDMGKKINGVLKDFKAGRVSEAQAEQLSREFADSLRRHSTVPLIGDLLEMSPEQIGAHSAAIKRAIQRGADISVEFGGRAPRGDAGRTVPAGGQSTSVARNTPGRVSGGERLPDIKDQWFPAESDVKTGRPVAGTKDVRVAQIPGQIARRMRGMQFKSFDEFRQTFWKMVAEDPVLGQGWSANNLTNMRAGRPPGVISSQRVGGGSNAVYQINHKLAIKNGGAVYDLDNLEIVTPKFHGVIGD